ncbi:hypothetical protein [Arenimonas terrae]|uniref:hypothetical protein n=1 Tax=Arenimonas terrae TaxID=2546226 RepID=UPI00159EF02D|nr:hypothetical protein [Arenimonas terrae]
MKLATCLTLTLAAAVAGATPPAAPVEPAAAASAAPAPAAETATPATPATPAASAAPAGGGAERAFAEALVGCRAATHQGPHPFVRGFVIDHAIAGETDGACAYSQTMPGEMRMECKLSVEGRAGLAAEFRAQAEGRMSGGTGEQPAWTRECEIVTRDGKRMPMQSG